MKISTFSHNGSKWADPLPSGSDSPQTLVTVFGATSFLQNKEPLLEVKAKFPLSKIIGCSTAGEILGRTVNDGTLVVSIVQFDSTRIESTMVPIESSSESFEAGKKIAEDLNKPGLKGVLVFSDGLNVNGSRLVLGLNSVLPSSVVTTGGLAADDDRFQQTWVLNDGEPASHFVSAVGLYGDNVNIGHGSKGGWDMFGPERRITRSHENTLFELDGKPALELYKNYLGDRAAELPASALLFPLSLRLDSGANTSVVRTILSVDEEQQSMTFAGDVPEGALVQLMRANFDRLIDGASDAALMTRETNSADVLTIAISCVGRRLILGERAEEELDAVMDSLPVGVTQVGFYSYGEISPSGSGHCDLHNQTMTLTTISEN